MADEASVLRHLIFGFRSTQLLYVAAKLGVADQLEAGPKSAEELGEQLGAEPHALYRVLRALASLGILSETSERAFSLTATGELLRTNAAGSMRSVALLYGEDWIWQSYGNALFSVRTGLPAFPHTHGLTFYDFLKESPAAGALFQDAMSSFSEQEAKAILIAYDFADVKTIVDVGAGHGALLTAILRQYPHLRGIAFDVPAAAATAQHSFAGSDVGDRASFVGGDFFRELPAGHDLYLLKSVLHNWNDADATRILKVCRNALSSGGRLLVVERLIPEGNSGSEAKLFDINMLITVGGQERTEREYEALLSAAGFAMSRIVPTSCWLTLIEAT